MAESKFRIFVRLSKEKVLNMPEEDLWQSLTKGRLLAEFKYAEVDGLPIDTIELPVKKAWLFNSPDSIEFQGREHYTLMLSEAKGFEFIARYE